MGVNYQQECILGFCLNATDLKKEVEPAKYVRQPQYDTKTGEITHYENVLIKQAITVFEFAGLVDEYLYELGEQIGERYEVNFFCDEELLYIGYSIADRQDCGRADMLRGEVTLEALLEYAHELKVKFPDRQVNLCFDYYCG